MKSVFVTVGTTSFDELISCVTSEDVIQALRELGYGRLVLQIGRGAVQPVPYSSAQFTLEVFRYKDSITEEIRTANLVISHAGAGSCLETLGAGTPLLVVVNDQLMNNHQLELARQLHQDGHLYYCTCSKSFLWCPHLNTIPNEIRRGRGVDTAGRAVVICKIDFHQQRLELRKQAWEDTLGHFEDDGSLRT
ncbi:UDP-N-acetylglucosamine transferase subunit ALG13 homolog isoform X1 [Polyodon spathula]|uniref:UDP-N-acetylglucosamine transferase subunit ALG13 homolog isoform X1 n=1 Tax=Polyodon spathula TaxID=7913 RepID=UPI001B7F6B54|nr:UDP-N-acetylglucosamine transferase subunit ALG13 homolog isoform X1 [Polyodon spathula]